MSSTLLGSASRLERVLKCPASAVMPGKDSPPGAAAERGKNIHRFLELAPEDYDKALEEAGSNRKTCEKIDIVQTAGYWTPPERREIPLVYHVDTDTSDIIPRSDKERDYGTLTENDVPGTADVVIVGFSSCEVWDYKTGKHPVFPEGNPQLLHLALMASQTIASHVTRFTLGIQQLLSYGKWKSLSWECDQFDLEEHAEKLRTATEKAKKAKLHVLNDEDPPVTIGEHCKYCPAKGACPEWR